jgi:hypothetical protein
MDMTGPLTDGQKDKRDMDKHNSQILITENCRLLHIKFLTSRSSTICAPPSLSCSGSEYVQVFLSFVYLCIAAGDPVIKKGIPLTGLIPPNLVKKQ